MAKANATRNTNTPRSPIATPQSDIPTDPVFAAIDAHKKAWDALTVAVTASSRLEGRLGVSKPATAHYTVLAIPGSRVVSIDNVRGDVENAMGPAIEFARKCKSKPASRHMRAACAALVSKIEGQYRAADRQRVRVQKANGWAGAATRLSDAHKAEQKAKDALLGIAPTTRGGLVALVAYIRETRENLGDFTGGGVMELLSSVEKSLKAGGRRGANMGARAKRPRLRSISANDSAGDGRDEDSRTPKARGALAKSGRRANIRNA